MSSAQKFLLSIHACYGLATTMSGLFLNLYLWRLSNDLTVNASFILVTFFFGTVSFAVGALLSKKTDRIFSFQIGIAFTAIFYLLVIILQEKTAAYPMLIGILNGTAAGFYWLGYLVLIYDLVDNQSRSQFMGKQMAVFGVVNTIGPAFAGFIISKLNLLATTLYLLFLCYYFLQVLSLAFGCQRIPQQKSFCTCVYYGNSTLENQI
ncbi:MFS transporter [Bacillus sp. 7884-1]|uniref:MFS transporter n=1 Tax=Bacillus sp. 7884-1 TaxID=2021693 RepID=UPI000BA68D47|nr:MFS transporter [Bacillus sp. 7884-1]PAE32274.1 hypothetical protein CHI06_26970 [Bacillus sp. 7884-1]